MRDTAQPPGFQSAELRHSLLSYLLQRVRRGEKRRVQVARRVDPRERVVDELRFCAAIATNWRAMLSGCCGGSPFLAMTEDPSLECEISSVM